MPASHSRLWQAPDPGVCVFDLKQVGGQKVLRAVLSSLFLGLLVAVAPGQLVLPAATAATCTQFQSASGKWPGDPGYSVADWNPVKLSDGTAWVDAENDGSGWNGKPEIDVASDALDSSSNSSNQIGTGPSGYWAVDSATVGGPMVYYRVRLQGDPRLANSNKGNLTGYNWQGVIAVGNTAKVIVGVIGSGNSNAGDTVYAGAYGGSGVCEVFTSTSSDLLDSDNDTKMDSSPWHRVVPTNSNGQFFLDFAVPFDILTEIDAAVTTTAATKLLVATSTSANQNSITADNQDLTFSSFSSAAISGTELSPDITLVQASGSTGTTVSETVTAGTPIRTVTVSNAGGSVTSYSISPSEPAGLTFNTPLANSAVHPPTHNRKPPTRSLQMVHPVPIRPSTSSQSPLSPLPTSHWCRSVAAPELLCPRQLRSAQSSRL